MALIISRTDLARRTREIMDRVRDGQTVVVQSYGDEEIVLLDVVDYHILRALASYSTRTAAAEQAGDPFDNHVHSYLDSKISLTRLAENLGLSRFDLMDRFERLGVPLRIGPETIDEGRDEIASLRKSRAG